MRVQRGHWIGVDWDGTLFSHKDNRPNLKMVELVKKMLAQGIDVRIFSARGTGPDPLENRIKLLQVKEECRRLFGKELPITPTKDEQMHAILDDRAVAVVTDTGQYMDPNYLLEGV